jgi:putative endonuclease
MGCWYVYLIECRDGSVYTGIATDVARRHAEHAAGKGARYTRSHPPLRLLTSSIPIAPPPAARSMRSSNSLLRRSARYATRRWSCRRSHDASRLAGMFATEWLDLV